MWKIRATHESFKQEQKFKVVEYWRPRFDVNVTIPPRLSEFAFGVYGLIAANYTSGRPVKGNATVVLELRDPRKSLQEKPLKRLQRSVKIFEGKSDFLFTMAELKSGMAAGSQIGGNEVWVNVTVYDWFHLIQRMGYAYSFIFSSTTRIKFLGGFTRPFKPRMYFTAYIVLYQPDGSKVKYSEGRRIELDIFCNDATPYIQRPNLPILDDGTVQFTFRPMRDDCHNYRMVAKYRDQYKVIGDRAEQYMFRYISDSDTYLQITTSTKNPTVNRYMVFTVETNYYTPEINYQIAAGGNIVFADKITMSQNSMSKTFSLAISRDMAPVARLLAYYVKLDGEVVTDSLTFFANITFLNNVQVTFNRGKDLNVDTLEVNGFGHPGSFLSFNAIHYDLFLRGGAGTRSGFAAGTSVLQDINLIDELSTYELHAQQPFSHTWFHDEEYTQRVYFPSPSFGPDANKTMNFSGLILFTDANYTKVSWWHDCNETLREERAFPCYSSNNGKRCYSRKERCNGIKDCGSAVDEMNCATVNKEPQPRSPDDTFQHLSRHFDDGGWFWKSYFVKPDGRIDFRVNLPKIDTSWVVGAFSVDQETGFSVTSPPAKVSGVRRFFITLEAPEEAVWGEQLGVRVAVFNYWDYWAEALLELKRSSQYEVVQVGWRGSVSSYSPNTVNNRTLQTLVYLGAGESKYIYIPVIPRVAGNSSITICAYTFVGSNCETHRMRVRMNGVGIRWHTPYLLDLTRSSKLMTSDFRIRVPQQFVEPETRELRYVPGSPKSSVSVVGDVIGPALNKDLPFVTTKSVIDRPDGAAENVLFEWSYNIQLLQYLRSTQQLTTVVRHSGLEYCNKIFQRVLSYFNNNDGGFFNFREHPNNTSPWLTAIALQTFVEVSVSRWDQHIYVPNNFLEKMISFLEKHQVDNSTSRLHGSFPTSHISDGKYLPVYRSTDSVPTAEDIEVMRRVPVTALAAIALKTQGLSVSQAIAQRTAQRALIFLKQQLPRITDVFSLALTAYALTTTPGGDAEIAFLKLNATQRRDNFLYFSNGAMPYVDQILNQAGQPIRDPRYEWWNDGYGTQSTALALLTYYQAGKQTYANEISSMVEWLTQQRNTDSGFSSTQDSLWALRALRRIAEDDFNRGIYSLKIKVEVTSQPQSRPQFIHILKQNFSSVTVRKITPASQVHGFFKMSSEGTGKALLQVTSSMNVDFARFLKKPMNPLNPEEVLTSWNVRCYPEFSGRNLTFMKMRACASWVAPEQIMGLRSHMAVLEVGMPTGYVVMNDELRAQVRRGDSPNLRYAFWQPGRVDLYFDYIGREETCVTFNAMRWYPVANMTQTQMCRVYDYYEPGRFNHSLYHTFSLFSLSICHVCGSYECPFCPDFNTAVRSVAPVPLTLMLVLIVTLLPWTARTAAATSATARQKHGSC